MKNIKKIFALFLTCAVLFSTLAGALANISVMAAPSLDASTYVRLEAEPDAGFARASHWFGDQNQSSVNASGGKWVGNLGCDHNKVQKFATLKEYYDNSNTPAVTFTVNAPSAGEYNIVPGYMVNEPDKVPGYYMTILVNNAAESNVYRVKFEAGTDGRANIAGTKVELAAGNNTIRLIPIVAETKTLAIETWMNIDYLDIDKSVTPVSNVNQQTFNVESSKYYSGFTSTQDSLSGDLSAEVKKLGITAQNLKLEDLANMSYFSFTFDAAMEGYYNIEVTFLPSDIFAQDTPFWYGYIVNGVPQGVGGTRRTNNTTATNNNVIDFTAKFRKGTNTVVVTNSIAKENTVTDKVTKTKFETLTIYGNGITLADTQLDPLTVKPTVDYLELPAGTYGNARGFYAPTGGYTYTALQRGGNFYVRNYDGLDPSDPVAHQYVQSFAEMQSGTFDKSALPYVAFHVQAKTAGDYMIKPNLRFPKTLELSEISDYFFIVSVNDERYYTVSADQLDLEGNDKSYELKVTLDAGVNVIRYIPLCKETYKYCDKVWGDPNNAQMLHSLMIQSDLKGISNGGNFSGNIVTGNATSYYNIGTQHRGSTSLRIEDSGTSDKSLTNFIAGGQSFDTVTQETLDKVAYIAHTFDVPADGYYDVTLTYNGAVPKNQNKTDAAITGTAGGTGYFVVRVDGTKHKVSFCEPAMQVQTDSDANVNAANLSLYLTKGSHTILASGIMDWKNSKGNSTHHVTYLKGIGVNGGMTVSTTQVDPKTIPDTITADMNTSHLEAEIFATSGSFEKVTEIGKYSAASAYANTALDADALQSVAEVATYLDKTNMAYVTYMVNAKEAGTYTVKPVYYFGGTTSGYSLTALVNDSATVSIPFVQDGSKLGWNAGTAEVTLEKGINVIRFIPYTADNKSVYADGAFILDYVDIENGIKAGATGADAEPVVGVLPQSVTENAGEATYVNGFGSISEGLAAQTNTMELGGITIDTLNKRNADTTAYFSYTVNVPVDGYYDISLPFVAGKNGGELAESDYTFAVFDDGTVKTVRFGAEVKDAGAKTVTGTANASIKLTAGEHSLMFIAQLPETAGGQYGWTEFSTVTFNGGITIADVQKQPIELNRLEAELYGDTSTYSVEEWGSSYSNEYAYGNGQYGNYKDLVSAADMANGVYNENYANVSYKISSDTDREGMFRVTYTVGAGDVNAIPSDMYIWVYIKNANGTQAYKAKRGEWINAQWAAGENILITSIFDKDTYDRYCEASTEDSSAAGYKKMWVNADCIDLDDGLIGKMSRTKISKRAEAETYAETFQYNSTENGSGYSNGVAVSNGGYGYSTIYTEEEYMSGEYANQPHVSYTFNVEEHGFYQFSAGYSFGSNGDRSQGSNVYLVIKDNNNPNPMNSNGTSVYKQTNSATWVENVELYPGTVEVIVTIFDYESYMKTGGSGLNHTWINQDYLDYYHENLGRLEEEGLEYCIKIAEPESALPEDTLNYTRFEAESVGFKNYYNNTFYKGIVSKSGALSPESLENAQTVADIKANGLNEVITPYVMYLVDVEEAGEYELRIGSAYKTYGTVLPNNYTGHMALFVNDDTTAAKIFDFVVPDLREHILTNTAKVNLKAGRNIIKVTAATSDTVYEEMTYDPDGNPLGYDIATLTLYQDYLDVSGIDHTATGPESVLEAESANLRGYTGEGRGGASGGQRACNEQYTRIISGDVTFDKLVSNSDYLAFTSYVEYEIVAPEFDEEGNPITEEILYPIVYRGSSGKSGTPLTDNVFFAVRVNDGPMQKLEYRIFGTSGTYTRVAWVSLKPGVNKLLTSCILKDIIASDGNLYYIDHDCIYLPKGFTIIEPEIIPAGAGDENMDVAGNYLTIKGGATVPADIYVVDSEGNRTTNFTYRAKVGSYYERGVAADIADELIANGYDAQIILVDDEYAVYVGRYTELADAEAMAATLYNEGYADEAIAVPVIITKNGEDIDYGVEGSPSTGENLLLVLPMLFALAAFLGMAAFFANKKKIRG